MKQSQMDRTPGIQYRIWIHSSLSKKVSWETLRVFTSRYFNAVKKKKDAATQESLQKCSSLGSKACWHSCTTGPVITNKLNAALIALGLKFAFLQPMQFRVLSHRHISCPH